MDTRLQNYYTSNKYIKEYMINMLNIKENNKILEPSVGSGEFLKSILKKNSNVNVDGYDINKNDTHFLSQKYKSFSNVKIYTSNTLMDANLDLLANTGGYYDRVIGNPPYGAWIDYSDRKILKKRYAGLYSKESYILFLIRSIRLLKDNGKLVFIIPDTYLFLNLYRKQRVYLLKNTIIQEILIFPSKFFDGISFGYSNLSIITLRKSNNIERCLNNNIQIYDQFNRVEELKKLSSADIRKQSISQKSILESDESSFILDPISSKNIRDQRLNLGDISDCVTGIYTGNNQKFLAVSNKEGVRNSKNYEIINKELISFSCKSINGIENNKEMYVPIVKGSSKQKYVRKDNLWLIKWTKQDIFYYQHNKKSRFQNSSYYFRHGIALPMVKSSVIRATEMNNMVFDQSIVGIFPKDERYFDYILGFLNSNKCNELIHSINPTANNSANYLKRIPIILPNNRNLMMITELVNQLKKDPTNEVLQLKLDKFFDGVYK